MSDTPRVGVLVASTRCAAGESKDSTGPVIAQWARAKHWQVDGPHIVADGEPVGTALRKLVSRCQLVITTGGTGLTPDDQTPEQTRPIIDRPAPGIAELIRARGLSTTPFAALSRGIAGIAGGCLVVNLPGSTGGVHDGLDVLNEIVEHALDQLA